MPIFDAGHHGLGPCRGQKLVAGRQSPAYLLAWTALGMHGVVDPGFEPGKFGGKYPGMRNEAGGTGYASRRVHSGPCPLTLGETQQTGCHFVHWPQTEGANDEHATCADGYYRP